MKPESLYGTMRILALLAQIVGAGCIGGAVTFFTRTPRPYGEFLVPWFLVAVSTLFVLVIAVVWLTSYRYWRREMWLERDYWKMRGEHDGG